MATSWIRPTLVAVASLALLALSGCSGAASGPGPAEPSSATPAGVSASASPSTPTPTPTLSPQPAPTIILEPDGLGFLVGPASIQHLTFADASADAIRTALTKALGPLQTQPLPECGQGARTSVSRNGFSALLDGTRFVGWTDQGAKGRRLTTAAGLGIGSTLADVRRAERTVAVDTATLGPEFFVENGISGFLDGVKDTSRVTAVYAGETCFFR